MYVILTVSIIISVFLSRKQTECRRNTSPFPMTRVNCPAMSSSEMGVAEESPSQGGGFWGWKPSEPGSLSAPGFAASEEEGADS